MIQSPRREHVDIQAGTYALRLTKELAEHAAGRRPGVYLAKAQGEKPKLSKRLTLSLDMRFMAN